jgi:hypothetical protein
MAPNDTTVPTMRDIYGQSTQPTSFGNPVNGNSVSETLARMRMAHLNPLPPSMAVPDMGFNNPAYAALPPTVSSFYPAPNTIVNAATEWNSPAVQTTLSLPLSKPKKTSSRPKHTDNALQDDCAAPAENQKQVCVLKLTYHRGVEKENENSLTQRMTEILGYRPTTNAYEKRGGEIKADNSKFAMPNLDKTLCECVVCKSPSHLFLRISPLMPRPIDRIGLTEPLPIARILVYILKFKNELPKSAVKYMYKALLVSDPEEGQFVHRFGLQQPTINAAACSLLNEEFGETIDDVYNTTSQRNHASTVTNPSQFIQQNYLPEAAAFSNDAMVDQGWTDNFYNPISQRNHASALDWTGNFALPTEEAAVLPTAPGNAYISQPELGNLYDSTSQLNHASNITNPNADAMIDQDWTGDFALPAEAVDWPADPGNGYINPPELGNLYHPTTQLNHASNITNAPSIPAPQPDLDLNMFDGPVYSTNGPNFFTEALAQDGGFPLDFNFNDDMPGITDHDQDMQDAMPALDDSLGESMIIDPTPGLGDSLGEDFVTPPTPALTTPPEPSLEPQGLCTWGDMIPPMGHAAPYLFDDM